MFCHSELFLLQSVKFSCFYLYLKKKTLMKHNFCQDWVDDHMLAVWLGPSHPPHLLPVGNMNRIWIRLSALRRLLFHILVSSACTAAHMAVVFTDWYSSKARTKTFAHNPLLHFPLRLMWTLDHVCRSVTVVLKAEDRPERPDR